MNFCKDCQKPISDKATWCHSCANKNRSLKSRKKSSESIKESHKKIDRVYFDTLFTLAEMQSEIINIPEYLYIKNIRPFIRVYPKLYKSIESYINYIGEKYNLVRLSMNAKIHLILAESVTNCACYCNTQIKWDYDNSRFQKTGRCCKIPPNSLAQDIITHGIVKGYITNYKKREKSKINKKGQLSLKWFKAKYGDYKGQQKYDEYWRYNFSQRKNTSYSKISQHLFNSIIDELDQNNIRYATFNKYGEFRINFNKEDKKLIGHNRITMFVDFKYKDKIIELDGTYWHKTSKDEDEIRDIILRNKGYKILRIGEEEYIKHHQKVIDKCKQFLKD